MRILAIAKKVLKELLRDKRTLLMMFLAPILIMWLMNVMFSANSSTNVTVAMVNASQNMVSTMDDINHIKIKEYSNKSDAKEALKKNEIDAIIVETGDNSYDVTYGNTDSTKTTLTRQAFKTALTLSSVNDLKANLKSILKINPGLSSTLSQDVNKVSIKENYHYGDKNTGFFAKMLPILMGYLVFFFVFLISGMALLKERTNGTLDRLLATPVRRSDIVFGYMISYGLLAIFQTVVIVLSTIWFLDLQVVGNITYVILINLVLALVALAFGILMSTLAKSEFQMMQFIPLIVIPQLFFSGIIPLDSMADWVSYIGKILPISYSSDALTQVIMYGRGLGDIAYDLLILLIFLVILTIANILGLRRYRKV